VVRDAAIAKVAVDASKERAAQKETKRPPAQKQKATGPGTKQVEGYAAALAELDKGIVGLQRIVDRRPKDWLMRTRLAERVLARASLSHDYEDYAKIQTLLDEAFSIAVKGAGPFMLAARFNFSVHRLDKSEEYLEKMKSLAVPEQTKAQALLRADIALFRGQYEDALAQYQRLAGQRPSRVTLKLALYHGATGNLDDAKVLLESAITGSVYHDGHGRAWTRLQLAILDMERGRYDQALKQLRKADALFPNWWLVREHMAEVYTLLGEDEKAIPIYEEVVRDTNHPQFMDALAGCYERQGREDEAKALIAKSRRLWDKQLQQFPEAAGGHGLEHYLEVSPQPEKALTLALANVKVRPGGDARVLLAKSYLNVGQSKKALAQVELVLATPYRSADLHDVASQAYEAVGHKTKARAQRDLCLAINPRFK